AYALRVVIGSGIGLAGEPSGKLDSTTSAGLRGLIKRTSADFRQTVGMITLDDDIGRLTDRIVLIEVVKIVE
ncbi:ABC transporter ATP-binding protein, partial [Anaerobutyricum soehngenii]|nr:ABC transporter ATP-binding protein [Anaerobutyricum soehngenii]